MEVDYIFVYGTLRSDFVPRRAVLDRVLGMMTYIGAGAISAGMYDMGSYPAIVEGEGMVEGELYSLSDTNEVLRELDYFESNGSLYERVVTPVVCIGKEYQAWVYWYLGDVSKVNKIKETSYIKYLESK